MAIRGYVVLTEQGAAAGLAARLAALPGCDVVRASGHDLLLLVTDAPEGGASLPERVERMPGVVALMLTFGALEPPPASSDRPPRGPHLPVLAR